MLVFEVMTTGTLEEEWWRSYRGRLEWRFRQKRIIVRAQAIRVL